MDGSRAQADVHQIDGMSVPKPSANPNFIECLIWCLIDGKKLNTLLSDRGLEKPKGTFYNDGRTF
jgi:hypothetical protein